MPALAQRSNTSSGPLAFWMRVFICPSFVFRFDHRDRPGDRVGERRPQNWAALRPRLVTFSRCRLAGGRARPLPGRRQRLPEGDEAVLDLEVAAGGQVLAETADHLPGRADAVGDVLMGQPLGDDPLTVALDG